MNYCVSLRLVDGFVKVKSEYVLVIVDDFTSDEYKIKFLSRHSGVVRHRNLLRRDM